MTLPKATTCRLGLLVADDWCADYEFLEMRQSTLGHFRQSETAGIIEFAQLSFLGVSGVYQRCVSTVCISGVYQRCVSTVCINGVYQRCVSTIDTSAVTGKRLTLVLRESPRRRHRADLPVVGPPHIPRLFAAPSGQRRVRRHSCRDNS